MAMAVLLVYPLGLRAILGLQPTRDGREKLLAIVVGLLFLFAIRSICIYFAELLSRSAAETVAAMLRKHLYEHVQRLPLAFFAKHHSDDVIAHLTNDVQAIRRTLSDTTSSLLLQIVSVAGSCAIMFYLNWHLACVIILLAPLTSLLAVKVSQRLRHLAQRTQECLANTSVVASEGIRNIEVVKTYLGEGYEEKRYGDAVDVLADSSIRAARVQASLYATVELCSYGASVLVFLVAGFRLMSHLLTAGDLVAFLVYSERVSNGFGGLARFYSGLNSRLGAMRRIVELQREPEEPETLTLNADPVTVKGSIAFQNVSFSYGNDTVLSNISFSVRAGEVVAIIGESGAGKTTLMRLLPRLYVPTAGAIYIDGIDTRLIPLSRLRSLISVVQQDILLFDGTVRENIRYANSAASDADVMEAAKAAYAHGFISQLPAGYGTQIGERGARLSGGERQRISVARAFLKNAPIVVLDEPTSALDQRSEAYLHDAMLRLMKGKTTFCVSHRQSLLRGADRILELVRGTVMELPADSTLAWVRDGFGMNPDIDIASHGRLAAELISNSSQIA
jgi:subfamily B ATP-binding cassette protein MsbA